MANIKSAEKRMRQTEKRRARNRGVRSRLKSAIKSYRSVEDAKKGSELPATISEIDRLIFPVHVGRRARGEGVVVLEGVGGVVPQHLIVRHRLQRHLCRDANLVLLGAPGFVESHREEIEAEDLPRQRRVRA